MDDMNQTIYRLKVMFIIGFTYYGVANTGRSRICRARTAFEERPISQVEVWGLSGENR